MTAADAPKLALKWAFGFPNGNSAYGQPSVAGGRVFVGADTGFVYALDAASGCIHWSYRANAGVRVAPAIGPGKGANRFLAYFGDTKGNIYAVDAETGALVWKDRIDPHPVARVTGSPKVAEGRRLRADLVARGIGRRQPGLPVLHLPRRCDRLRRADGQAQLWTSYTITEASDAAQKTSKGTQLWGPAGASVWSSPTIDLKRRAIYVSTGNAYTEPAAPGSDAVIAFDLDSGKRLWVSQMMANDAYVRDCPGKYRPNVPTANKSETCPDTARPGHGFRQRADPAHAR